MHPDIRTTKKILHDRVKARDAANNTISPEIREMSNKIVERWERMGIKIGEDKEDTTTLEKRAEKLRKFSSILK